MRLVVRRVAVAVAVLSCSACTLLGPSRTSTEPSPTAQAGASTPTPTPEATGAAQWSFTVVRHAERADDGTDNPPLTEEGRARAGRLAEQLSGQSGVAVYATPYQRTQSTAGPTAETWGVGVTTYDPTQPAANLVSSIRAEHSQGAVLIVGHSDTVPQIVSELCRCQVDPIEETDFSNLYRVELGADGTVLKAEQSADY